MAQIFKPAAERLMPGTVGAHSDSGSQFLFMSLYFVATGLHALHLTVGILLLGGVAWRLHRKTEPAALSIENVGLYWHLMYASGCSCFPCST